MSLDLDELEAAVNAQLALFGPPRPPSLDELVDRYGPPGASMPVQLCCGMGVDSAAIITQMIDNPDARVLLITGADGSKRLVRVDLADVTVVTAMTGDEYTETEQVMNDHLLPLMASVGMRYVQISRAGQSQDDGIVVLDDSRRPARMVMQGPWRLRDELSAAGTVPQTAAGARRCSARAKGWPLDVWAAGEYGDAERIHIIGFAAEEDARVAKDSSYSSAGRRSVYPLRQWGWDRQACLAYLRSRFGVEWPRSCCSYCPFAGGSVAKNALVAARWAREPQAGALAVLQELTALALNPRMALFKTVTAWSVARQHHLTAVFDLVQQHLDSCEWALYDVQRVHRPKGAKAGEPGDRTAKGRSWRRVRTLRTGTRAETVAALRALPAVQDGVTPRLWLREAGSVYPAAERFLVAAPSGVQDKELGGFAALWDSTVAARGADG